MDSQWFVARQGGVIGPMSQSELTAMVAAAQGIDLLIWTDGFSDWRKPDEVEVLRRANGPAMSALAPSAHVPPKHHESLIERARNELIAYAMITAYLYVCFSVLLLYKAALLSTAGVSFMPFGLAAIKALVLGKFLLLLHSARVGERIRQRSRPISAIALQAMLFAALLIILTLIEELIVGTFHGKSPRSIVSELADGSLMEAAVTSLLMMLVLTPYFTMREINKELGDGVLFRMLLRPKSRKK